MLHKGGSGVKRLGSRRQREAGKARESDAERECETMGESVTDMELEELRDFLAADLLDVPVDPAFKESLRRRLWEMVRRRGWRPPDGEDN
jgi:hypothetical protein